MTVNEMITGIREQLKNIKEAVSGIEFRLSQLESESMSQIGPLLSHLGNIGTQAFFS